MVKGGRVKEECKDCKVHTLALSPLARLRAHTADPPSHSPPPQKFHQELFPLPRLPSGREWEDVVLPVMRRWERFVRLVADETCASGRA